MIPLFKVHMPKSVAEPLLEVLFSGYIGQGPKVDLFEKALVPWVGNPHVLSVNSGTSALHLAMRLAGVNHGAEVISSPMTCSATGMPALERGAQLVWADIDPWTGNIDPLDVERKITPRTKAIIPIHWGGYPCDLDELRRVAQKYGIPLIEDAAHAFGATYRGKSIGGHSEFTCFLGRTRVITERGAKRIDSILVGERALTSDGNYHKVVQVHRRTYKGSWVRLSAGQIRLSATSDHPIRVYRDGVDQWLPFRDVKATDCVYVETKSCSRCTSLVPSYGLICSKCFQDANISIGKREKVQAARSTGNKHSPSRALHHNTHVVPQMRDFVANGYRVIPMAHVFPDFIAIKDGKVIAVEVESKTSVRLGKQDKYDKIKDTPYDDVIWITQPRKRNTSPRYSYEIVGHLARVPVVHIRHYNRPRSETVYNLAVEGDPTYFANSFLVHNCFSLQAIKLITTLDGGILSCKTPDMYRQGKLLRWFGIDRETPRADLRCENDIVDFGYKHHMHDVSAVIGLEQLKYAEGLLLRNRDNAAFYRARLADVKGVKLLRYADDRLSSYWLFTIRVRDRDGFQTFMTKKGIQVSRVHVRNDLHTYTKAYRRNLPGVDEFEREQVSIPVGWWISDLDREAIARAIEEWSSLA